MVESFGFSKIFKKPNFGPLKTSGSFLSTNILASTLVLFTFRRIRIFLNKEKTDKKKKFFLK